MRSESTVQPQAFGPAGAGSNIVYPIAWAAFLTAAMCGPWLASGYLFGTDWPGQRYFTYPTELASSAPLQLVLAASSRVATGEVVGKVFVLATAFVAALTSFKAVPVVSFAARAAASTVFTLNPFVYGRLHYGQLFLLAAYALLPWFAVLLRQLLSAPGVRAALANAVSLALIGMFSPHVLLIAGVLTAVVAASNVIFGGGVAGFFRHRAPWLFGSISASAILCSYWVVPLLLGRGTEGAIIASTGSAELYAYAARPDAAFGLIPNLLGLFGFWAEDIGRFTSMKVYVPGWPAVLAVILSVCVVGALRALCRRGTNLRPWALALLIAGAIGLALEVGVSSAQTAGLVTWLDSHFVLYRGLRDAGKWATLLALVFSQLVGLGADEILSWPRRLVHKPVSSEWTLAVLAAALLAVPLYYGNGLLFGSHGTIQPSEYPAGWYSADRLLTADSHPDRTLFVPWHEYMRYSFIRNENKVAACPAPSFFSVPVLASKDPEVPGIAPPATRDQSVVDQLVRAGPRGSWAVQLESLDIKYVLVAKELDWQSYGYLATQQGLIQIADLGSILVYRNELLNR